MAQLIDQGSDDSQFLGSGVGDEGIDVVSAGEEPAGRGALIASA